MVYGMFSDHVDPELGRVMRFPRNSLLSMWILVVKHDQTVQITSRLNGQDQQTLNPELIMDFLHENLSLFHVMVEEDP